MTIPIPPDLRIALLPSPKLSVAEFLQFPLPSQTQIHPPDISLYWCDAEPNMTHIGLHDLKDLPIPSSIVLGKLVKQPNQLEQSCSICYSHLPLSSRHSRFPLWILTYWVEVSRLRQHVRQPWASAELYLTVQRKRWKLENIRKLCDAAHTALLNLQWAGNVCGFEEPEPRTKLAAYLSQKWLSTSHIDQQLDLLRMDVERSGQLTCEVVRQSFFRKVVELYRDHEDKPYNKEMSGARHLWTIGEELASGTRDKLCGVVNIDNSHWVGVVIDAFRSLVLYGDSLGGSDLELKSAISWWIQCHTDRTFKHQLTNYHTSRWLQLFRSSNQCDWI
jgi:hypothetical protein